MKKIAFLILLAGIIAGCSKEKSNVVEPKTPVVSAVNYYPGQIGSSFNYKLEAIDSSGIVIDSLALVGISIDSTMKFNDIQYFVENVTLNFANTSQGIKSLFRRSDVGVYFAIDTSGYSMVLPDSLLQNITINSDPEINIFSYPLFEGKLWPAYKLNVSVGAFELSLVDVQAKYGGNENISVNVLGSGVAAERIDYNVKLTIPNPQNLLEYTEQNFNLSAWYVKDVGLSLVEGDGEALNTIFGSNVNQLPFTGKLRLSLIAYNLN